MTPEQIGLRYVMRQEDTFRLVQVLQVHMGDGAWVDVPTVVETATVIPVSDPGFTPQ